MLQQAHHIPEFGLVLLFQFGGPASSLVLESYSPRKIGPQLMPTLYYQIEAGESSLYERRQEFARLLLFRRSPLQLLH